MKRQLTNLLIAATTILAISCSQNPFDQPIVKNSDRILNFEVEVPSVFNSSTRALSTLGENAVTSVDIAAFTNNTFAYLTTATAPMVRDNKLSFSARVSSSTNSERYRLVVLANIPRGLLTSLQLEPGVTTLEEFAQVLTFDSHNNWRDGVTYLPMWGEFPNVIEVTGSTVAADFGSLRMTRSVAKLDVYNSDPLFELTSVTVCNATDAGLVIPAAASFSDSRVTAPTVPSAVGTLPNYEITTIESIVNEIYLAEKSAAASLGAADGLYVVLKGHYDGNSEYSYYRMDFALGATPAAVLRNHSYTMRINRLGGVGYFSFDDAILSPVYTSENSITVWNDATDITTDGIYSLSVEKNNISIGSAGGTGIALAYQTDYPSSLNVTTATSWITNLAVDAALSQITFDVAQLTTGTSRTGSFSISVGRLTKTITVVQNSFLSGGSGTQADPWLVSSVDDLCQMRDVVNSTTDFATAVRDDYYRLTTDLDLYTACNALASLSWAPIGDYESNNAIYFKGTFDGDGHTIHNLYINAPTKNYQGLFGYANNSTIKNLTVSCNLIGKSTVGAVVGCVETGTVENCHSLGSVSGVESSVGGIAGSMRNINSKINSCSNSASVTATASTIWYGGIVGCLSNGYLSNSYNIGTVSGSSCDQIGGVAGGIINGGRAVNCYNLGSVSGRDQIGGVGGGYSSGGTITNCYNAGSVSGTGSNVGGVVGRTASSNPYIYCCYYLTSCAADGNSVTQYGIGNATKGSTTADVAGRTTGFTDAILKGSANSAENVTVGNAGYKSFLAMLNAGAYLYNNPTSGSAPTVTAFGWTQTSGSYPEFDTSAPSAKPAAEISLVGAGTSANPYQISTLADLELFGQIFNNAASGSYASASYKLMNDIDMSTKYNSTTGTSWTPIGDYATNTAFMFKGTFDGNNHTISNLYINATAKNYQGLFGYVYVATITDLNVSCAVIVGSYSGGVAGKTYGVNISNCNVSGSVVGDSYLGGVVGYSENSSIRNSKNTASVTVTSSSQSNIGGIVGFQDAMTITNCANSGIISGATSTGGVVGGINNIGTSANCTNSGTVSGSTTVGGVAGYFHSGKLTNCYNVGSVSGTSCYVGGVVGNIGSITTLSYNYYLTGSATDGGSVAQNGVGFRALSSTTADVAGKTTALADNVMKGSAANATAITVGGTIYYSFLSMLNAGAYVYNNPATGTAPSVVALGWTQTSGSYPVFGSAAPASQPAAEIPILGAGTSANPYQISTLSDLEFVHDMINDSATSSSYGSKYYALMADIDMSSTYNSTSGLSWTPIGDNSTYNFSGYFDGNGHNVNIYISSTTDGNYGLFGSSSGTICNLGISGSITVNNNSGYTGAIAGSNMGSILSCHNSASVTGKNLTGGIAGFSMGTMVSNCYNTGTIHSALTAGGLTGHHNGGIMINCYNTGSVTSESNDAGGLSSGFYGSIYNCYNAGTVTATTKAGGLIGTSNVSNMSNCYNTGTVTGTTQVGSLIGYIEYAEGNYSNCYYLTGSATDGSSVAQYGVGNATQGSTTADVAGKTTALADNVMKGSAANATAITVNGRTYTSFLSMLNAGAYLYNNPATGTAPTVTALGWTQTTGSYPVFGSLAPTTQP
ncbi:MAG: GLUG motif-containing protein [Tidjanibacter sp.]|nr:GLUG motif-containing protein [Tidjanibacter sp.]